MIDTSTIPWERDLDGALAQAKSAGTFVLLDIFNPG